MVEEIAVGRKNARVRAALGLLAAVAVGACTTTGLKVTGYHEHEVYYATDRAPTGDADPNRYFGPLRGSELRYGRARVPVPLLRASGRYEPTTRVEMYFPERDFTVAAVAPLDTAEFYSLLRAATSGADTHDVIVYVHGYANSFRDALLRAAQIKHDIEFPGMVIAYTWPSQGELALGPSSLAYTTDEANVEWSAYHFRAFLQRVLSDTGSGKVHLIAHSMGNRAVASAALDPGIARAPRRLHQIVLAAPDIDRDVFQRDIAPHLGGAADRVTLYVTRHDHALRASQAVHGYPRVGNSILVAPNIDTVDVSAVDTDVLDLFHDYFIKAKRVLADIKRVLLGQQSPDQRGLTKLAGDGGTYWTFPVADAESSPALSETTDPNNQHAP